jgi:hypothetical protein
MSRYFFNIYNGNQSSDDQGTECRSASEVRAVAIGTAQDLFTSGHLFCRDNASITVNVVDNTGKTVMIVGVAAYVEVVAGSSLAPF